MVLCFVELVCCVTDENMKGPVPEAAHVIVKAGGLSNAIQIYDTIHPAAEGQEGSNIFTNRAFSEGRLLK